MKRPSNTVLWVFQVLLGAMDCTTGVLLMLAPVWTLRLMGIRSVVKDPVMVSWVGAFVFAVGLTYFLVGFGSGRVVGGEAWRTQWRLSGMIRLVIGIFVGWKMMLGELEPAWISVAITDLIVAAVQLLGLRSGWLSGRGER